MANLDSILKSRDITLPTKVCLVKAMFYPGAAISGVAQSRTRLKQLSRQHIKKQRHYFANKGPSSQGYGFSSETWNMKKAEH